MRTVLILLSVALAGSLGLHWYYWQQRQQLQLDVATALQTARQRQAAAVTATTLWQLHHDSLEAVVTGHLATLDSLQTLDTTLQRTRDAHHTYIYSATDSALLQLLTTYLTP
jgi:hypothetical protein